MNNEIQPALIFIPDISGFTRFINETEVIHSSHIISELLEVIIESDELGLEISEIEGDAVFFYRLGEPPTLSELVNQCEKTFIEFQRHLKTYERDRICQCGACSTAGDLTLKFVSNFTDVTIVNVKEFVKLMGPGVTLTHKLLKNDIKEHEYALITGQIEFQNNTPQLQEKTWLMFREGHTNYEEFGTINYHYFELSPLSKSGIILPPGKEFVRIERPLKVTRLVKSPVKTLHSVLTNLELRSQWMFGVEKVIYDDEKLYRVGASHNCLLPLLILDVEATRNMFKEGKVEYAERINEKWFMPEMTNLYVIEKLDTGISRFTLEVHYKKLRFVGWIFDWLIRFILRIVFKKSLKRIKKLAEEADISQNQDNEMVL